MKKILFVIMAILCGQMIVQSIALAQVSYPTKLVTIWVGFPPGGSTDTLTRVLAEVAEKRLGQKIVVINKPGAGGAVAASLLPRKNQMVIFSDPIQIPR